MENSNIDKITGDMLRNSKLELKNPDFNRLIMQKVVSESRTQKRFYNILFYSLIFVSIDVLIFLILKFFNFPLFHITQETVGFTNNIYESLENVKSMVIENSIMQYVLILLAITVLLCRRSTYTFKY